MADIKQQAALVSIAASVALSIAKLTAAWLTGSLGLFSDALNATLDVGATILTYFAVRLSGKPADDTHHYGHGKIEAVAALAETGLLFVIAAYVAVEAIMRLRTGAGGLEPSWIAFVVLALSIIVDVVRSRSLVRIARETRSEALAADALHFTTDLVSSSVVLLGLIAASAGYPQADTLAAIGVAVFITMAGWRLGRRTVNTLMDAVPSGVVAAITKAALGVRGVVAVESLRVRSSGTATFGELQLAVARTLPLDRIEAIKARVAAAVTKAVPGADLSISTKGHALNDETILERVLHVAASLRRPVHHVTVQHVADRLSVSLDLEIDGRKTLAEAHRIATELEDAISDELGTDIEVETHIEPLDVQVLTGEDLGSSELARIEAALARHAAESGAVSNVHDVRVRKTALGLVVNYHCYADPRAPVASLHAQVDAIERAVRQDLPEIARVVGHAEPAPPA